MCGIAGTYNIQLSLNEILLSQQTRGPDVKAQISLELSNQQVLQLGHNRLKIIDLTDDANQPFCDESQNHILVFNGEIYNYLELKQELSQQGIQFQTNSDTEVLLQSLIYWGIDALSKLNGMFAFAYFDRQNQKLYLVRDRFGVKPLYYYLNDYQLVFASTSSDIAKQLQLTPDLAYVQQGLDYGIYENGSEQTAYLGLNQLRAGHVLEVSFKKRLHTLKRSYYCLEEQSIFTRESIQGWSHEKIFDEIAQRLMNACSFRLRSDVPIAVALSGGLDSSIIAAFSKEHAANIEAYCFGDLNDLGSEAVLAQQLSSKQDIHCHFVAPENHEWQSAFWQTLTHQDAPIAGVSVVAQNLLYQKISQHGVKVVLGGQGGDEAFLGYRKFQLFLLKELMAQKNWLKATQALFNLSQMLYAEKARIRKFWQLRAKYNSKHDGLENLRFLNDKTTLNLGFSGSMNSRQIDDVMKFSLPTLLRYEDRNSMTHSIESRLPFMDYQLMELACAIPAFLKLKKGYGKWPLRHISQSKVPDVIRLARYKKGFDISKQKHVFETINNQALPYLKENEKYLRQFIGNINIDEYFNSHQLNNHPSRFAELTSLCWLSQINE